MSNMKELKQTFTIHPVGQGLFYSGVVNIFERERFEKSFKFVFDCGSDKKTNCKEEVDSFIQNQWNDGSPLDLLIISHFHSDHINCIKHLLEGRQVKLIIAPFVNFTDRLLLSLLFLNSPDFDPDDPDSLFTLRFIIDPISTGQEFLAKGGQFVLIKSDEIRPFEIDNNTQTSPQEGSDIQDFSLNFSIPPGDLTGPDRDALRYFGNAQVRSALDTSKSTCSLGRTDLMEFLFYRKPVCQIENEFYQTVFRLFINEFPEIQDPVNFTTDDLVTALTTNELSETISRIFKRAFRIHRGMNVTFRQIKNLNSTSLSLLHSNKRGLYELFRNRHQYWNGHGGSEIIRKLDGTSRIIEEISLYPHPHYHFHFHGHYDDPYYDNHFRFPNTMITSDGFLLSDLDIASFYQKYMNYWDRFWLFQIPHHGSKNNIDRALLSRISNYNHLFINFGIRNRHKHPSKEVIDDIKLTRHSNKLLIITEYSGLRSILEIYYHE
jgi:hypothetical protein